MGNNIAHRSKEGESSPPTFKTGSFIGYDTFRYLKDSKSWDEARKKKNFIQSVERYLFDNLFLDTIVDKEKISAGTSSYGGHVDFDMSEEQRKQAQSNRNTWRLNAEAGNVDDSSQLKIVSRLLEEITLHYPVDLAFDKVLQNRLVAAVALDTFLVKERELALVTYRNRKIGEPATPTHTNEICLKAMSSILTSLDYKNEKMLSKPMKCLSSVLRHYEPLSLFAQWSPPKAHPEVKSIVKALNCKASPTDSSFPAENVVLGNDVDTNRHDGGEESGKDNKFWRSTKDASSATFDIELDREIHLASVVIVWADITSFENESVLAPREWSLHARLDDKDNEKLLGHFVTSNGSVTSTMTRSETIRQRLAAGGERVRFLRIRMKGFSTYNMGSDRCFGIRSISWYESKNCFSSPNIFLLFLLSLAAHFFSFLFFFIGTSQNLTLMS